MKAKYSYAQQICIKKSGLALSSLSPLWPGCRVGVAVSGGVDSFTLLKVLSIRKKIVPFKFELLALHCNPGFAPEDHAGFSAWLFENGLPGHIETGNFGILAHSEENRKNSPCFLCAWHRRKRLFELCKKYSLTHLAIGHNADDMLDTFMLNFFRNGRVAGLAVGEKFFNGSLSVIRPLLLVEKKYIRQAARQWALPIWQNACPSNGKTARSKMADTINTINSEIYGAKKSAVNALIRWQMEKEKSQLKR